MFGPEVAFSETTMILCNTTVYDGAHKRLQKLDSFDANLIPQNINLIPQNANLILLMQT